MTARRPPEPPPMPIPPDPRDPPVNADGTCSACGNARNPSKVPREPHRGTARLDPFCSSECARAWYGVTLPSSGYSTSGNAPDYRRVGPRTLNPNRSSS